VAPPGNQAETEKTNINLQHRKKPVYSPGLLLKPEIQQLVQLI